MNFFSNLFNQVYDRTANLVNLGKSFVSNVGSAASSFLSGKNQTASVLDAVNSGPFSGVPGVSSKTGLPNMTLDPNQQQKTSSGSPVVTNQFGQTDLTKTYQGVEQQAKQQALSGYGLGSTRPLILPGLGVTNVGSMTQASQSPGFQAPTDQYGRQSSSAVGQPYQTPEGKWIIPQVGFSGLQGAGGGGITSVAPPTGDPGIPGSSAFTGNLGAAGLFSANPLSGTLQSEEEKRKQKNLQDIFGGKNPGNPTGGATTPPFGAYGIGGVYNNPGPAVSALYPSNVTPRPTQSPFSAPQISPTQDVSDLSTPKNKLFNTAYASSINDVEQTNASINNNYNQEKAVLDQQYPTDKPLTTDTPEQISFIEQSGDPFGIKAAMDAYKLSDTNLIDLESQRIEVLKSIQALNKAYQPIIDDIKNNPNLPKGLATRRLEDLNKKQKEVLIGFKDQLELLNQSISDQNQNVNRKFNILTNAQGQAERAQDNARQTMSLLISSGAIGGMSDKELNQLAQGAGVNVSALKKAREVANDPTKNIITETDDAGTVRGIDKSGKILWTLKGVGKSSSSSSTVVTPGFGGSAYSQDPSVSWIGQAATNIANTIYAKDQRNTFTANVNNALKNGDTAGAKNQIVTYAKNKILTTDQRNDMGTFDNAAAIADSAIQTMKNDPVKFGPYKTAREIIKPFFGFGRDPDYTAVRQAIELAQAQIRKGYYGTAVTSTEAKNANKFLINNTDDTNSVIVKLQGYSNFLRWVNDATVARAVGATVPDLNAYISGSNSNAGSQYKSNSGKTYNLPY